MRILNSKGELIRCGQLDCRKYAVAIYLNLIKEDKPFAKVIVAGGFCKAHMNESSLNFVENNWIIDTFFELTEIRE